MFVFPTLILAYLGQGARLIRDGDAVIHDVFYSTIPGHSGGPLFWFVIIAVILNNQLTLSQGRLCLRDACNCELLRPRMSVRVLTVAKLTASQAMVTATFSLVQQIVNMKSLPSSVHGTLMRVILSLNRF
jgi:KUP system potassium uptake protein